MGCNELGGACEYAEADWYCAKRAGHDGAHESVPLVLRDGHEEWCASCRGPESCDCGWTAIVTALPGQEPS